MINGTVFIGDKAFGDVAYFHIYFRTFQVTAKGVNEDANILIDICTGDPKVVDSFNPALLHRKIEWFDKAGPYATCFVLRYSDKAFVIWTDACSDNLQSVPFCRPSRIIRTQRHVMDAWRTRVIEIRVFEVENAKRRFSDREEGDHLAFEGEIGPRQSERATEETADRLGVAGDERQIGQRIVAQNSDFLPLHEMH